MVFSGLCPLVIEDVVNEGERIGVRARTPQDMAPCPVCGGSSGRVHGYHWRTVADVPVDGRRVVVRVRVRRLACPTPAADTASRCPECWGRDGRSRWSGLKGRCTLR
jgi:transposase